MLTVDGKPVPHREPTLRIRFIDPIPMGTAKELTAEEAWQMWQGLVVSDGWQDTEKLELDPWGGDRS